MENMNVVGDLIKKIEEVQKEMRPANIMLIGKTGVGKSTLINSTFRGNPAKTGIGRPVTQHLEKITNTPL